nr:hypothetical protein [uncultured Flavobacterium sp.]
MKKIITLLVLFFAFSINANAQDTAQIEKNAKKDLEALASVIKIDNNMEMPFYNLFKKKHEGLSTPNISEATKKEIASVIEAKLRASLDAKQTEALEKNKAVFAQLISAPAEVKEKK